jgi:cyclopropane fatty-acyl-phospholipid synthase-like methyltransferase
MPPDAAYQDALARFNGGVQLLRAIPEERLRGARFLDVGCGQGGLMLAAIEAGASTASGVDIDLSCFGYDWRAEIAAERGIDLGRIDLLAEGDFCDYPIAGEFDVVTCFDALEHVGRPAEFMRKFAAVLAPEGIGLIDVSPLYYSQIGHHLWPIYPRDRYPWVHLWRDFDAMVGSANADPWLMRHFQGLNKITVGETRRLIADAGMKIRFEWINRDVGRDEIASVEGHFDAAKLPADREDLFIEWMQFGLHR